MFLSDLENIAVEAEAFTKGGKKKSFSFLDRELAVFSESA
jgi:hypothetical protein